MQKAGKNEISEVFSKKDEGVVEKVVVEKLKICHFQRCVLCVTEHGKALLRKDLCDFVLNSYFL